VKVDKTGQTKQACFSSDFQELTPGKGKTMPKEQKTNPLRKHIIENMQSKDTEELLDIWYEHNTGMWTEEAFEVVRAVLVERLGKIPKKKNPPKPDQAKEKKKTAPREPKAGPLTRKNLTELLVRLLAFWLLLNVFGAFMSYLPDIISTPMEGTSFEKLLIVGITVLVIVIILAVVALMLINSERIARFIWIGKKEEGEAERFSGTTDLFKPLIAVLGAYLLVTSLSQLIPDGIRLGLARDSYFYEGEWYWPSIAPIFNHLAQFVFGVLFFAFPETITRMQEIIRQGAHGPEGKEPGKKK
jgi:uncharacterized membrane protein (DUF485 family)